MSDTDQVTDALERLRSETDQGCWTPSDWEEHAADIKIASDYALAATDERGLTREWLEGLVGNPPDECSGKSLRWLLRDNIWLEWSGEEGAFGWLGITYLTIFSPADAIEFFQLTRWPVSRQRIVEAWRKMR